MATLILFITMLAVLVAALYSLVWVYVWVFVLPCYRGRTHWTAIVFPVLAILWLIAWCNS